MSSTQIFWISLFSLIGSVVGFADPATPQDVLSKSREVRNQIENKADNLVGEDLQSVFFALRSIERTLQNYPDKSPFRLNLVGTDLTILCNGKEVTKWSHHQNYEIRGDIIVLLDSTKEFAAYRCDGTAIVKQWKDVVEYRFMDQYIGLLDSKGIYEAYSLKSNARIIKDWRDTIKTVQTDRYIALLDSMGIFEGYNIAGERVIREENTADIQRVSATAVRYTLKDGTSLDFPIFQE